MYLYLLGRLITVTTTCTYQLCLRRGVPAMGRFFARSRGQGHVNGTWPRRVHEGHFPDAHLSYTKNKVAFGMHKILATGINGNISNAMVKYREKIPFTNTMVLSRPSEPHSTILEGIVTISCLHLVQTHKFKSKSKISQSSPIPCQPLPTPPSPQLQPRSLGKRNGQTAKRNKESSVSQTDAQGRPTKLATFPQPTVRPSAASPRLQLVPACSFFSSLST